MVSIVLLSLDSIISRIMVSFPIIVSLALNEKSSGVAAAAIGGGKFFFQLVIELVDILPLDDSYLVRQNLKLAPIEFESEGQLLAHLTITEFF